jgi:general secretion pathway protein D
VTRVGRCSLGLLVALIVALLAPAESTAQVAVADSSADSIHVRIVGTDLRTAVQLLGQHLDRAVLFTGSGTGPVTLESPGPVSRRDILPMLRGLVESQNFEIVDDTAARLYRVRPREAPRLPPGIAGGAARTGVQVELHVVPLQHARAVDVASTVNALYGRGSGSTEASGRVSTLADDLRANQIGTELVPPPGPGPVPSRPATLSGELTVVADPRANSLLVRANANDIALIRAVVDALDVRPLQVLIEVLVAEVRRDRSLEFSVEGVLQPTAIGNTGSTIEGSLGTGGLGDFALKVMGIGGMEIDGTLRAAAARGDVKILTRPIVLATNNQTAEINVGTQRPFVQVQRSLPTDGASRDQVVQYRDVGTKLTVRPTISADGSVQLEVTQEVSTATAEVAFNAPVIATRSLRTQLLVRDGQTVALGGLTDRVRESRQQGLPLLSSIPFLGGLFGGAKRQTVETELFVFLTPRVIRTDDDAMRLTTPMRQRAGAPP